MKDQKLISKRKLARRAPPPQAHRTRSSSCHSFSSPNLLLSRINATMSSTKNCAAEHLAKIFEPHGQNRSIQQYLLQLLLVQKHLSSANNLLLLTVPFSLSYLLLRLLAFDQRVLLTKTYSVLLPCTGDFALSLCEPDGLYR